MCGISGIVNSNGTSPVDPALVKRMASAQAHRGPDDWGMFVEQNAGLGHRRLSIIDLSGGKQPMFNEDESVVVVFNGEIYNYADLTADLIQRGHRFKTRSDTETIVHAYEEFGDECVQKFRGMFAFALWDRRSKRLLLVRDRLGIKPVYYYANKDVLVFASEIKALFEHPAVPREMDPEALDEYLALRYVPGPRTMFKHIFKLQPGHLLTADSRGIRTRRYWDVRYEEAFRSEADWLDRFGALLEESVRLRLVAEVPLGVFLSGGLDSSTMVALMSRITNHQRVKTFSVGYDAAGPSAKDAAEANEFTFAREAAAHFRTDHHELKVGARDFADGVPDMVRHLDEPLADPSCIPLYFISKLARRHITVVLSGEGGDEILGGYSLYRKVLQIERWRQRFGPLSSVAARAARLPVGNRARGYLRRLSRPLEQHYRGVVKGIAPEVCVRLMGEGRFESMEQRLGEIFGANFHRVREASSLNRMLYADAKVWLPENLLLKADKMTMAAAVELRVPFLDHRLVEFAASMPDSLKIRGNQGKWLLRSAMGNVLPPRILQRPKQGFPSPTSSWLRLELREFVQDTVLASNSACRRFFDADEVQRVVERHRQGSSSGYQDVWSLVVFEHWHRHFLEDSRSRPLPVREAIRVAT